MLDDLLEACRARLLKPKETQAPEKKAPVQRHRTKKPSRPRKTPYVDLKGFSYLERQKLFCLHQFRQAGSYSRNTLAALARHIHMQQRATQKCAFCGDPLRLRKRFRSMTEAQLEAVPTHASVFEFCGCNLRFADFHGIDVPAFLTTPPLKQDPAKMAVGSLLKEALEDLKV